MRQLLVEKFGKDFALQAAENKDGKVAERVLQRLRIEPPERELVTSYLVAIAETYRLDWPKKEREEEEVVDTTEGQDDDDDPNGGQKVRELEEALTTEELSKATPPRDVGPRSPVSVAPPKSTTDNLSPKIRLPQPPELKASAKMSSGLKKQDTASDTSAQAKGGGFADVNPKAKTGAGVKNPVGGKIPDVNELAARFAALKK